MVSTVVFDFDGTLADALDTLIACANEVLESEGYGRIDFRDDWRTKSLKQVLLEELRIPKIKIPIFARKMKSLLIERSEGIRLFDKIPEVIKRLRRTHKVGILTSNSDGCVRIVLEKAGVDVDFIYVDAGVFGKHRSIAKMCREQSLRTEDMLYVGDEIRDIEACRKAGVRIIAVTWGYNAREALEKKGPDFIASTPEDIPKIVSGL